MVGLWFVWLWGFNCGSCGVFDGFVGEKWSKVGGFVWVFIWVLFRLVWWEVYWGDGGNFILEKGEGVVVVVY